MTLAKILLAIDRRGTTEVCATLAFRLANCCGGATHHVLRHTKVPVLLSH